MNYALDITLTTRHGPEVYHLEASTLWELMEARTRVLVEVGAEAPIRSNTAEEKSE